MSDDRKLLVLPVTSGTVEFATDDWITVGGVNVKRSQIVGRQPIRNEAVIVLDVQDLADALLSREGTNQIVENQDELVEVFLNGTATQETDKSVLVELEDEREVWLPKRYVNVELGVFVREVKLPRWLAEDRRL